MTTLNLAVEEETINRVLSAAAAWANGDVGVSGTDDIELVQAAVTAIEAARTIALNPA